MTFSPAPPFFSKVVAAAARAAADTGLFTSVVLAQWANETAYGTSEAWVYGNNPAGISPDGKVASYPSQSAGYAAYVETMNLSYYDSVRAAKPEGPIEQAYALGRSPWAGGHYTAQGGTPGSSLVAIIEENDLTAYDDGPVNPTPAPAPAPTGDDVQLATISIATGSSAPGATQSVQYLLYKFGQKLTPDGDFGPLTQEGVVNVQRFFGGTEDGIVGPWTWGVLLDLPL